MLEYRSYSGLDDRVEKDGDVGFVGFNNRLRPDQLAGGMLADAQNVRMDRNGEAQVRKGIDLVEAPFTVSGSVLRLPTTAQVGDGLTGILPMNIVTADLGSTTADKVTIKLTKLEGTSLTVGDSVTVAGITAGSLADPNGVHTLTDVDASVSGFLTVKYALDDSGGTGPYTVAVRLPQTLPFTMNGIESSVVGKDMILSEALNTEVNASAAFSDPNDNASQHIIIASNASAVAKNLSTRASVTLNYPTNETIPPTASMLQAFNKVFIFRDGTTTLENNLRISTISAASLTSNEVFITTSANHNLVTGDVVSIANLTGDDLTPNPNVTGQAITYVSDTQFKFSATGDNVTAYTVSSTSVVSTDFTKVASGTYTQPVNLAATGFTITNGLATVTVSNTLSVGDTVTLTTAGGSTLTAGTNFILSEASSSEFKFFVESDNVTNQTDVHFTKRVSVGLGFTHMPAPEFAVYHQRRLVMPFKFDVASAADTYTSRGILDEIIASDILDTDTYDQIYAQYRFNAGEADFVVGLHSFSEDNLMVFNRNSIHLVSNTTTLQGASTRLLTDEVGCVARDTIRQVGSQVIFLSDNGIYSTQFFDEYNLRGTETPLSEPINSTVQRIQKQYWSKSVAVYFDNRYYIAVPLDTFQDGLPNNDGANNALLIYNFLNKQWESIDQVNNNNWNIDNLIVAGEGTQRAVYAINSLGGIHSIDTRVTGDDLVITDIGETSSDPESIKGSITTRQYTLGNLNRKSWREFELHVESSEDNDSDLDISFFTENPDTNGPIRINSLSNLNGGDLIKSEDVSIRGRIGNRRGHGIQFIFNNTEGRPKIRAIRTSGSTSFRSTQKAI
tara:strand:+ start:45 stop:2576 length:2532 start_codon:yes stop_codon:yes gene_type:complete